MDYRDVFKDRVQNHIDLVNKYAEIIGHSYPYHDSDKLQGELFEPYALSKKYGQTNDTMKGLTEEEAKRYNDATIKHITRNPHHPEYWLKPNDMARVAKFDRNDPPMNLDCSRMSDAAIIEMCCDWCAMSEEFGNSPFEWFEKNAGFLKYDDDSVRWRFTNQQYDLISETLMILWGNEEG